MTQTITGKHHRWRLGLSLMALSAVFALTLIGSGRFGPDSARAQTGNASITIVKQGLAGEDIASFTHDMSPGGSFELTQSDNTRVFSDLAAGTYHVTELPLEGYVLVGTGCSLSTSRVAPGLDASSGNTLGITVAEGQDLTCTFVNGQTQVLQYDVTVSKLVDEVAPVEGSFAFTATWTAANLNGGVETSGDFALDAGNSYQAVTSAMDAGADYSVIENDFDDVCDPGDAYRLIGYSVGMTAEEAAAATPGAAATFTDLQSDQYVVVHNEACAPAGTSSITIVKDGLTPGAEAVFTHDVPGQDSDTFTLTADANSVTIENLAAATYHFTETAMPGWNLVSTGCAFSATPLAPVAEEGNTLTVVLGDDEAQTCTFVNEQDTNDVSILKYVDGNPAVDGSFDFTETSSDTSEDFSLNAENAFQHASEGLPFGVAYGLVENGVDGTCDEGDTYRLAGYSLGTTLEEALAAEPMESLEIASLEADTVVVVWNQDCANIASITIVKDFAPDSDAEAAFTVDGNGLEDFSIPEGVENGRTFDNLDAGAYSFTETELDGWSIQSIFCSGQSSPSNVLINLGGASATVTLNPGDNIVCTFTNMSDGPEPTGTGTITIIKNWDTDDGPNATFTTSANLGVAGNTFDLIDDGVGGNGRLFVDLASATYQFTESGMEGWTLVAINCTGIAPESVDIDLTARSLGVNLADDEDVVCTFSNELDVNTSVSPSEFIPDFTMPEFPVENTNSNTNSSVPSSDSPLVNSPSANLPITNTETPNAPSATNPEPANTGVSNTAATDSSVPSNTDAVGNESTSNVLSDVAAAPTPVAPSTGNATNNDDRGASLPIAVTLAVVLGLFGAMAFGVSHSRNAR